ncbi:MAG: efflux RND transporter periplasmic adaptor subunit [Opitutus sp.]
MQLLNAKSTFFRPRRILLLAALLSVGAIAAFNSARADAPAAKQPVAVKVSGPKVTVASVEEKLVTDFEELTGRVDATETVELRARVSGHLDAVRFQAGQMVHKGDVLFSIDPRWYRAQFELAASQADQARAHADIADREAKRAEELLAASAISNEEAEARRSRALEARAAHTSAIAAMAISRLDFENTEVRAPIDGRIGRPLITAGNLVSGAPGNATLLTTIVSAGDAFVYADIDETTLLKFNRLLRDNRITFENGRVPVEMQLADETGYPRRGYIESSDNHLNASTGSLVLRLVFSNADNALVPGLFARVRVPIGAPQSALLVSERAIGTDQSQKFVLAVTPDNTAVYRSVTLGGSVQDKRVVRSGLRPGDRVIVNGLQRVRPGMTVEPEPTALAAQSISDASAHSVAAR